MLRDHPSLQFAFAARLQAEPDRRALAFYTDQGDYAWQTFAHVYQQAARHAAALAELGLERGDVCLIVLPSGELSASTVLACLLMGAVPLLIAPPSLQAQAAFSTLTQVITRIIQKTKPRLLVGDESLAGLRADLEKGHKRTRFVFGSTELSLPGQAQAPAPAAAGGDVAAMQLTSGTTGMPRVCVWQHRAVLAALKGMYAAMGLGVDDVCLNWTPMYHDMGLVNNFLLCLTYGIPLVMLSPTSFIKRPALWLQSLQATGATTTWSPNFGFALAAQRVREDEAASLRLDHVRAWWSAAERIHYATMLAFHRRFAPHGVRFEALKTNFGCAENIGGATFTAPGRPVLVEHVDPAALITRQIALPVEANGASGSPTFVSCGRGHPNLRLAILAPSGRPLPDGHIGEIALQTPSRMSGYLRDAAATQRALFGDWLRTGDLGYLRDGELFWAGRVRERINVRGVKLDPSDFEPILLEVPGLRPGSFAAFGVDSERDGTQRIVLVTEVRDATTHTADEICSAIRGRVFEHLGFNLQDVVLVREGTLTKTSSGKRRHRYFREQYASGMLKDF
ncbi:MAG: AMP-binding protein, partial [Anaerolineales bacterium]|nr:AMP-binding protein [Anaerolineales bacterium]